MTTRDDCLRALREAAAQLGESPTKAQYEGLELTPLSSTIRRLFGSWNEAKARADLETRAQRPGRDGSIQPQPDDVTLPDGYEWGDLTPQQRWYYKNRRGRIERKEERRRALREWFQSYKRDHCACAECGESHPACLDFHHDEAEKTAGVSEMVNDGYSKERILDEMAVCTVLCATCHRHTHNEAGLGSASDPPDSRRRRQRTTAYKRASDGCKRCDESRPWCLDFHHPDEKHDGIARMVSDRRPLGAIEGELERCELLCANCHRMEHHDGT
ncbi:MAG: hypothetical protein V5A31_02865 [Haloferacaceae archaeon]